MLRLQSVAVRARVCAQFFFTPGFRNYHQGHPMDTWMRSNRESYVSFVNQTDRGFFPKNLSWPYSQLDLKVALAITLLSVTGKGKYPDIQLQNQDVAKPRCRL